MSQLLSAIELVPTKSKDIVSAPLPGSPHLSNRVPFDRPRNPDGQSISSNSARVSIEPENGRLKQGRIIIVIAVLTGLNLLSSLSNGFITVGLPRMASDLGLPQNLLVWPTAVY
jgi:hypothetical protein